MCKISAVIRQFITICCCNLLTLSFGTSSGWGSINFVRLQSENTTFPTGKLSLEEATFVVSISNIGSFVGNFAIIYISRKIGLKNAIHTLCLPQLVSLALIVCAQNKYYLLVSRFLSGFCGGSLVVAIPIFVADICHDKVRGALNSLYDPFFNVGVLLTFTVGNFFDYADQAKVLTIVPFLFSLILLFLPESPKHLRRQQKQKKANKSLRFFKGSNAAFETGEFLTSAERGENLDQSATFSDFINPRARRALFISFTSIFLSFFSGMGVVFTYVTAIFVETKSNLSADHSSLLISFIQICANLTLLNVVERFNRKTLYIGSSIATSISFLLFAVHCSFWMEIPSLQWMPQVYIGFIIFSGCLGLLPVPYLITIEILPKKILDTCLATAVAIMWVVMFVLNSIYPPLSAVIGLPACMYIFSFVCVLNALFGLIFMFETRGKSHEEIMVMLSG